MVLYVPEDHVEPFGRPGKHRERRLALEEGVFLDWDEQRLCQLMMAYDGHPPMFDQEQAKLVLLTASGVLVVEEPTLTPERAVVAVPLLQTLASHAASTASWASQLLDAKKRASEEVLVQQELRSECARLREQAEMDELTGLYNRRFFNRHLEHELSRFRRYGHPLSLAVIDIDHFKGVNDAHGHAVGDAALQFVAEKALQTTRQSDLVARIGGDELAVIMPDTPQSGGARAAERIRFAVTSTPLILEGDERLLNITLSIGVAGLEESEFVDAVTFFRAADKALFRAKERGRDQIVVLRDSQMLGTRG